MTFLLLLLGSLAHNAAISWHFCWSSLPIFILCRPFFQLLLRSSPSDDGWYVYICCEGIRILAIDTKMLKIIELKSTKKPSLFYFEEWTRFWYLVMNLLTPPRKKKTNDCLVPHHAELLRPSCHHAYWWQLHHATIATAVRWRSQLEK